MLKAKSARLTYAELLAPPPGYELVRAIGTTYSLDLYALIAMPVAMFYNQSLDGNFQNDRYDVLDALRQCEEKVTIFCQADKVKVPKEYKKIFAYIENSVQFVYPSQLESSFHPKIWVLRFQNKKKELIYRLSVLSRNMTFDQSWDIAVYTDGQLDSKNKEATKFSTYLQSFFPEATPNKDLQFFKDLEKLSFEIPAGFEKLEFFPILGFDKQIKNYPNPLTDDNMDELIVISPFLDKTTISKFINKNIPIYIFSRLEELQKLNQDFLRKHEKQVKCYYLNTILVEGASYLDTEGEEVAQQNLHAKIFVSKNHKDTFWYLGSANFTDPAFTRNAEFLMKLKSGYRDTEFKQVLNSLSDDKERFFVEYKTIHEAIVEDNKDQKKQLRKLCYDLSSLHIKGDLKENDKHHFDVILNIDLSAIFENDIELFLSPVRSKLAKEQPLLFKQINQVRFSNIALTDLSPFFVCTLKFGNEEQHLLLKIDIELPQERKDEIFKQLIGNKLRFLEYLQFLLSPNQLNKESGYSNYNGDVAESTKKTLAHVLGLDSNLYESLLATASRQPEKLKHIDKIIESLRRIDPLIVEDFLPIWNVYKKMIHD